MFAPLPAALMRDIAVVRLVMRWSPARHPARVQLSTRPVSPFHVRKGVPPRFAQTLGFFGWQRAQPVLSGFAADPSRLFFRRSLASIATL
jgi:hypothetical protein